MPLGLTELTRSSSKGCSNPNCAHEHDHGPLYLHGRCHPQASVSAEHNGTDGTLRIFCDVCMRPVTTVHLAERPAALRPCHPKGLEISFDREAGALRLVCRQCKAVVSTVRVADTGGQDKADGR